MEGFKMSVNLPIGGSGGSIGGDRTGGYEAPKPKDVSPEQIPVQVLPLSSTVNNAYELKKAELQGERYTVSDAQLVKAIEHAIKAVQGKSTSLEFSIHQKTKLISVKVLDKETGETIREIPPEKSLDFVAKLWEMAGILIDERR